DNITAMFATDTNGSRVTTPRDCTGTKCIQTFMGKMAMVALSTEWHWRRSKMKRLPLSSSLSSLLQRIFLQAADAMPTSLLASMPQTPGGYEWHISASTDPRRYVFRRCQGVFCRTGRQDRCSGICCGKMEK
ncbi:hypothetical protein M9458_014907, partial [Cirrhinus mrigala]